MKIEINTQIRNVYVYTDVYVHACMYNYFTNSDTLFKYEILFFPERRQPSPAFFSLMNLNPLLLDEAMIIQELQIVWLTSC